MISERLKNTILKQLELEDYEILEETKANTIPGWDSLSHANVILTIEKEYNIRLKHIEVLKCKNLGDLQRLVDSKLS
ncbi:MAG: acyl carrier protein [Ignavibacteriales bacterium]|jgi:acyl carrier protein|nr:acyl carrier protein [Ignavibacteriales bacterium]MBK7266602.1 acyl carrier protein [Ignavibacteriales bacterium]MBK8660334.1 acyl carrier protein [Ignavibacteriales bacterium]MCC6636982.1 acyl carrier protein [Ignavibacteriaceae bacterium]